MEEQIKPFKENADFQLMILELLKNQLKMECKIEALEKVLVGMLHELNPRNNLKAHQMAYHNLIQKALEKRLEDHNVFSPEMTALLRSEMKDIPGLDLSNLK